MYRVLHQPIKALMKGFNKYILTLLVILASFCEIVIGQNLITNSSAGTNINASPWTIVTKGSNCYTGNNWRIRGNQNGFPATNSGTYMFYSGCNYVDGELYQDVDVSAYATEIDASNQSFDFSIYMQVYDQATRDGAQTIVEYRNSSGTVLSSYDTGETNDINGWVNYTDSRLAPANTRTIRIRLLSISNSGSSVDGYFDDVYLGALVTLPVDLISFKVEEFDTRSVELNWITGSEINNDYFTIERSNDGENWEWISTVDGQGNSADVTKYSFTDEPNGKRVFYRLKQTDFDGKFKYSEIVMLNLSTYFSTFKVYPTASASIVNIESENDLSNLKIFNSNGQEVSKLVVMKNTRGGVAVDLSSLQKGYYFIQSNSETQKVVKI